MGETKNILITGYCGRIGLLAVRRFAKAGYQVIGWDYVKSPTEEPMDFYQVDLSSDLEVRENLQKINSTNGDHLTSVMLITVFPENIPSYTQNISNGTVYFF